MKMSYYAMNALFLMVLLGWPLVQSQTTGNMIGNVPQNPEAEKLNSKRDSLFRTADKILDVSIEVTQKTLVKKDELIKRKVDEQKALKNYVNSVNEFLAKTGRTEKVVLDKETKVALKKGEILLTKDSICVATKKPFLGKRRCIEWKYSWYLVDQDGKKEQLW